MRSVLGPLAPRPRLTASIGMGLAAGLVLGLVSLELSSTTRAVIAWDLGCIAFVVLTLWSFRGSDPDYIRGHAAIQDEGQGLILGLALATASASLAAVAYELSVAKDSQGFGKAGGIGLAFATVALSWFVVQIIFALHYAHEYYDEVDGVTPPKLQGGLNFPGDTLPDYWDFLHFSIVIGVASQTADVSFTSKRMRRLGTLHSLVAFTFNTVILALTINLLAGLV